MPRRLVKRLLLGASLAIAWGCAERGHSRTVYVFIDVTDSTFRTPTKYVADFQRILSKLQVDTNSWSIEGGEVRLFLLNDVSQSTSAGRVLRPGTGGMMGENRLSRRDSIRGFARGVWNDLDSLLRSTSWERDKSKIYQNLCRSLNDLARDPGVDKTAVIYSDMLENSSVLTFYGPLDAVRQRTLGDAPLARMEQDCALPDLSGVKVNIVTFRNSTNDERVNVAMAFWKRLFEKHGAVVHSGAQLR